MNWWGILLLRLLSPSNLTARIKLHSKEQLGKDVEEYIWATTAVLSRNKVLLFNRNSILLKGINLSMGMIFSLFRTETEQDVSRCTKYAELCRGA